MIINIIVFILTVDDTGSIRASISRDYGSSGEKLPFLNFFTSMFLHGDPFHIIGNMLFLWVFGQAVEGRLGVPRFLAVYFTAGLAGSLLDSAIRLSSIGIMGLSIGASGCILGIMGAYWYIFPWSNVCIFYWFLIVIYGVWEVAAAWVIGAYVLLQFLYGIGAIGSLGGVAYFCHVGGAVAGVLLCMALNVKRDSAAVSEAREIQADLKDMSQLPLYSLQTMLDHDPTDPQIIRALISQAINNRYPQVVDQAMAQAGHILIDRDPDIVAYYLTDFKGDPKIYHPVVLMRLAGIMERAGKPHQAIGIYYQLCNAYPEAPDVETALYRMANCYWNSYHDAANARNCIQQMMQRFPNGPMAPFARALLNQIR
jgi:membrane associated rhomboid family serine protease